MLYPTVADDLRRRRLMVVGVALGLLLLALVTYIVLVQRAQSTAGAPSAYAEGSVELTEVDKLPVTTNLPGLRAASDPETFARQVAEALFAWDTSSLITRTDHAEQLIAVADPTGESTPGLASDLNNYLPTPDAWVELARYETRQWLSVDSVTTPSKWAEAEAQAGDELLPGTTARTIHGTRHRSGVWEGEPVASEHDVAFTIFLVCRPSYPECHLLRLSLLDQPLD